jgi:hypothetical protein
MHCCDYFIQFANLLNGSLLIACLRFFLMLKCSPPKRFIGGEPLRINLCLLLILALELQGKSKVEQFCKVKGEVYYADCRTEGKDKDSCKLEAEIAHHSCFLERAELQQKINSIKSKSKGSVSGKVLEKVLGFGLKAL